MVKVFKVLKESEKYFMVFNFDNNTVTLVTAEELKASYGDVVVEGTLIEKKVKNAWFKPSSSALEVDGSLVLFMFVKDVKGYSHSIRFAVRKSGLVDKYSQGVGTSEKFFQTQFGHGLLA